jgi:hypothetical protein
MKVEDRSSTVLYRWTHPYAPRTWADGWRHLRFLLLYSPRWLFLPGNSVGYSGIFISVFLWQAETHWKNHLGY